MPSPFTGQGSSQLCAVHPEPVVPDCALFQTYSVNQVLGSRARLFAGMVFCWSPEFIFLIYIYLIGFKLWFFIDSTKCWHMFFNLFKNVIQLELFIN